MNTLEFVAAASTFGTLVYFTPLWGPRVTYGRIPRTTRNVNTRGTSRFGMTDVGCMFVYVAAANAMTVLVRDELRHGPDWGILMPILANVFAILNWWLSVRFADSCDARKSRQRVMVHLIFFPSSTVVVAWIIAAVLMLLSGLEHLSGSWLEGMVQYFTDPAILGLLGLLATSIVIVYGLRRGFRTFVVGSQPNV